MPNPSIFTPVINSYLPEPHASLLNGIIFGIPLKTNPLFNQKLKMVGLLHLVVLSGMNITMLAAIIGSLTKFLPKKMSLCVTIACIILFVLFVGVQAPVLRAAIMGIIGLLAIIYGRRNTALYSLFLSFVFFLIFWPGSITTISFQLSFGATLGIILFGNPKPKSSPVWQELKPSLAAQLFTTPIIFGYFQQISFIAPVANLLSAFIIAPIMVFGFLTALLGKIHFLLGAIPAAICYVLLSYLVLIIDVLSKIPFAYVKF